MVTSASPLQSALHETRDALAEISRHEERFADDVSAAMRGYADRIDQLLLDLGESVLAAVGAPTGGLLPTRESHAPPRPDLRHITVSDPARIEDELALRERADELTGIARRINQLAETLDWMLLDGD